MLKKEGCKRLGGDREKMNTKGKIAIALAVMMVAAATTVPMVMGDNPTYEVTVTSPQSTTTAINGASFGEVMQGTTNTITDSLTLTNTGGGDAAVKAKCENQSSGASGNDYGLIGTTDTAKYIGGGNMSLGTSGNLVALKNDGTDAVIDDGTGDNKVPAGLLVNYDATLAVPPGQTPDSYSGLVTLTFSNA